MSTLQVNTSSPLAEADFDDCDVEFERVRPARPALNAIRLSHK